MNSHLDEQFSKYLENLMSKEERNSFENELATNEELNNEFEEYQIGMIAGKRIQYLELKDKVSQIIVEEDSKKGDSKIINLNFRRLVRAMPAAVLVLLVIALGYISTTEKSGVEIYSQHIVAPSFHKLRGDSENNMDRAISKYAEGSFDSVLIIIDQMPEIERNQASVQRLRGHAYIAKEDVNSAMIAFKQSISEIESVDHLEAYWNIGRLYTKNEQYDSTLTYLNKVAQSKYKSDYKDPAKKMLSEIRWQNFIQSWFGWLLN